MTLCWRLIQGTRPTQWARCSVGAEVATLPLLASNNFLPDLDAVPEEVASAQR